MDSIEEHGRSEFKCMSNGDAWTAPESSTGQGMVREEHMNEDERPTPLFIGACIEARQELAQHMCTGPHEENSAIELEPSIKGSSGDASVNVAAPEKEITSKLPSPELGAKATTDPVSVGTEEALIDVVPGESESTRGESETLRLGVKIHCAEMEPMGSLDAELEPYVNSHGCDRNELESEGWRDFEQINVTSLLVSNPITQDVSSTRAHSASLDVGDTQLTIDDSIWPSSSSDYLKKQEVASAENEEVTPESVQSGQTWASTGHRIWCRPSQTREHTAVEKDVNWEDEVLDGKVNPDTKDSPPRKDDASVQVQAGLRELEQDPTQLPHVAPTDDNIPSRGPDQAPSGAISNCVEVAETAGSAKDDIDGRIYLDEVNEGPDSSDVDGATTGSEAGDRFLDISGVTDSKSDAEAMEPDERITGDSTLLPSRTGGPEAAKVTAVAGAHVEVCGTEDDAWSTVVTVDANEEDFGDLALLPTGPDLPTTAEHDDAGNGPGNGTHDPGSAARVASPVKIQGPELKASSKAKEVSEETKLPHAGPPPIPVGAPKSVLRLREYVREGALPSKQGKCNIVVDDGDANDWVKYEDPSLPMKETAKDTNGVTSPRSSRQELSAGEEDDPWGAFVEVPHASPSNVPPAGGVSQTSKPSERHPTAESIGMANLAAKESVSAEQDNTAQATAVEEAVTTAAGKDDSTNAANESDDEWSDFGDFEEAPTPSPAVSVTEARGSTSNTINARSSAPTEVVESKDAVVSGQHASEWSAFEESAQDRVPEKAGAVGEPGSSESISTTLTQPGPPVADRMLAVAVAIFNRAFPVEDLQGAVPRLSPDVEGDVCPLLEALVDEAAMKHFSRNCKHVPSRLGKWATSCILRGIRPVPDSLSLEESDDEACAGVKRALGPVTRSGVSRTEAVARERSNVEPSPPPKPIPQSKYAPKHVTSESKPQIRARIEPESSSVALSTSPCILPPNSSVTAKGDASKASNSSQEARSADSSPDEVIAKISSTIPIMPQHPPPPVPFVSPPLTFSDTEEFDESRKGASIDENATSEATIEASAKMHTGVSNGVADHTEWGDDPFNDFQCAPPSPLVEQASLNGPGLTPISVPPPEKPPTTKSPSWNLNFFMASPGPISSTSGADPVFEEEPSGSATGNSSKPLDLVSKALAGYGIADSPLWKSGKKPSAKRAPVFSLPEKSGSNGDVTGRQAGEGLSGDGIKELLRITRARGVSGRATSPPAAPLSASAKSRLAGLPDLSFMLSGRLRFPTVGAMPSASLADSE